MKNNDKQKIIIKINNLEKLFKALLNEELRNPNIRNSIIRIINEQLLNIIDRCSRLRKKIDKLEYSHELLDCITIENKIKGLINSLLKHEGIIDIKNTENIQNKETCLLYIPSPGNLYLFPLIITWLLDKYNNKYKKVLKISSIRIYDKAKDANKAKRIYDFIKILYNYSSSSESCENYVLLSSSIPPKIIVEIANEYKDKIIGGFYIEFPYSGDKDSKDSYKVGLEYYEWIHCT